MVLNSLKNSRICIDLNSVLEFRIISNSMINSLYYLEWCMYYITVEILQTSPSYPTSFNIGENFGRELLQMLFPFTIFIV